MNFSILSLPMMLVLVTLFSPPTRAQAASPVFPAVDVKCIPENSYAAETKKIFERSQILSIVPKLLEMAQIKELIPIMKEVEIKKDKDIYDYLMLNEIYDQINEPEKQIHNLQEAIVSSPDDPRPLLLLAKKMMETGRESDAQKYFYSYLENTKPHPGRIYLAAYVWAVMYPISVSLCLVGLILFLANLILKRDNRQFGHLTDISVHAGIQAGIDVTERGLKATDAIKVPEALKIPYQQLKRRKLWNHFVNIPLFFVLIPAILAIRFCQTKQALPFGALLLFTLMAAFFVFKPQLEKIYKPVLGTIGRGFSFAFDGILFSRKLQYLPVGWKFLIAFTALTLFTTVLPTIQQNDLKYVLMAMTALVFYSTLGSVLVSFLRTRKSLVSSLRWISIAATMPFLVSYIVSNWNSLGAPLMYARLPSMQSVDGLFNYLVFWGVSLLLALHLGKIIADALIQPLNEIIAKVAKIEEGDFSAKVTSSSRDEIGHLALAINRMGEGLEKREKLEKTFNKYVDKEIVNKILGNENTFVQGQQLEAVVLFADIRGFTSLSERIPPQAVVTMLNQFFEKMVPVVKRNEGVVDKFIGDNLMAVWGVPYATPQAEEKSLRAALEILEEVQKINAEISAQYGVNIGIGIGLNTGPVIAGSIGTSEHMEYTVIGDVVNSAQRAEANAKAQQVLISEAFYRKVSHIVEAVKLDPIAVKGKEGTQQYWSAVGLKTSS